MAGLFQLGQPTRAELGAMCRRAGCRIVEEREGSIVLGCDSHRAKVKFLDELARHGGTRCTVVRNVVELVAAEHGGGWGLICALHALVRDGVENLGEPVEMFSPAARTLALGVGDCDDQAIALQALLIAAGFRAAPDVLPPWSSGRPPTHVAPRVHFGGRWLWLEPTIDAEPGEPPLVAARRLGVTDRGDIAA